ncbi:MAG: hypothetical protein Q8920_10950 [Bacillota bacterium]|nr:hypothetical protein [Bacillota bacterium]
MRIQSSSIAMSSSSVKSESHSKTESSRFWIGSENNQLQANNSSLKVLNLKDFHLEISDEARQKFKQQLLELRKAAAQDKIGQPDLKDPVDLKAELLEKLIEMLTGRKIKINIMSKDLLEKFNQKGQIPEADAESIANLKQVKLENKSSYGWGYTYNLNEVTAESEKMSFSTSGTIKTSDGKEINFDLQLAMSREFISQNNISVRAGDALCDPLVINYDVPAASLTNTKFNFDLDCNGKSDQISILSQGSGFLALDKNGDGKINDGSELFGPQNGDGFSELSNYDTDKNGWIDENDQIFDKLRIWTKDQDGNDVLFALGQKGIGAIYLGNADTAFDLKDSGNQMQGHISKTGIFVKEDGTAGTIQHVDMAL